MKFLLVRWGGCYTPPPPLMYNVQYSMYNVQCTTYKVQCTMNNIQSTSQCTMYNIQCSMYVQCAVVRWGGCYTPPPLMYNVVELKSTPIAIILQYENLLYWDISNQWPYPLPSIKWIASRSSTHQKVWYSRCLALFRCRSKNVFWMCKIGNFHLWKVK